MIQGQWFHELMLMKMKEMAIHELKFNNFFEFQKAISDRASQI